MPLIGSFDKQPAEQLPVDIDYSEVIAGRTTSSISPSITVPSGMTKVSHQMSGETLQIYVTGGTSGQSYRWTVLTSITISGNVTIVEDEFDVVVLEI